MKAGYIQKPDKLIVISKKLALEYKSKEKQAEKLIISSTIDNTERKKDEERVEYLAATIVKYSDDAIISKSLDGTIKSWNKGGEKMFGYTAKQAIGKHISLIIPQEYIKEEKSIVERILNNEIIDHYETVRKKKNGEQFYVSLTVSSLKDRLGNIIGISKIARDITSGKKSEAELIHANKELVFQNEEKEKRAAELSIANIELAYQNQEKENRAAELIIANKELVFQNKEKENRAAELVIANEELAYQNIEKEKRAAELSVANIELAYQNQEKEKRAAELIIANKELIFQNDEKGRRATELIVANKELVIQNGEKEKRAAELIIANKELAFQNIEKEKRAAELIIANKELEQLTYIASHDLQEPLRTISNYMQVFEEDYLDRLDDEAYNYIRSVKNAAKRMSILVRALLDFSRLGRNKKLAQVDCGDLISNVIADLQTKIKESNTTIDVTAMPVLNIYEVEIGQLFQNLITNAIKFQKKGTPAKIKISSKKVEDKWKFSVSDNGIGIAPVHYERIFDIFQRLHSDNEYQGNGIGLANCKKIVELHQGNIWIESTPGKGTTFNFTIPYLSL